MFLRKEKWRTYYIYYTNPDTGKVTRRSTKTKNQVEALAELQKFKTELDQKKLGTIKSVAISEFGKILYNYKIDYVERSVARQICFIFESLDKFLEFKVLLKDITQQHINNFYTYLRSIKKITTIKTQLAQMANGLNYAKANYYLSKYSDIIIPHVKVPQIESKFLTKDEFLRLLNNCDNQDLYDISAVAFMTGMRLSELTNLRWEQVNFERAGITLNNRIHKTKTRKVRPVPFTESVHDILKKRLSKSKTEFVFTFKNRKWGEYLKCLFKKLVEKTFGKNSGISFHTLRHSYASNLVINRVDLYTIAKLLGHSSITTTQRYSHLNIDTLQKAVESIDLKI
jgi:integrase